MSHPLSHLIDRALGRAEAAGELENLPGAGKPIPKHEGPGDPVLNRLMTESKVKPPVVVLKEEIAASRERLAALVDEGARKAEMKVLADLQTRLALEMEAFRKFG